MACFSDANTTSLGTRNALFLAPEEVFCARGLQNEGLRAPADVLQTIGSGLTPGACVADA